MTPRRDISDELRPHVPPQDSSSINRIADKLVAARREPTAAFRVELRMRLNEQRHRPAPDVAYGSRPRRLGLTVAAYLTSAATLLGIAILGLAGSGPLGY
jgi:hypothetical protein